MASGGAGCSPGSLALSPGSTRLDLSYTISKWVKGHQSPMDLDVIYHRHLIFEMKKLRAYPRSWSTPKHSVRSDRAGWKPRSPDSQGSATQPQTTASHCGSSVAPESVTGLRGDNLPARIPEDLSQRTEQPQCWGKIRPDKSALEKSSWDQCFLEEHQTHHLLRPTEQFLSGYFCPEESRAGREKWQKHISFKELNAEGPGKEDSLRPIPSTQERNFLPGPVPGGTPIPSSVLSALPASPGQASSGSALLASGHLWPLLGWVLLLPPPPLLTCTFFQPP